MYFKLHLWQVTSDMSTISVAIEKSVGSLTSAGNGVPSWLQDCELAWRPGMKKFPLVELSVEESVPHFRCSRIGLCCPWSSLLRLHTPSLHLAPCLSNMELSQPDLASLNVRPILVQVNAVAAVPEKGCSLGWLFSHWTFCCNCQLALNASTSVPDLLDFIFIIIEWANRQVIWPSKRH